MRLYLDSVLIIYSVERVAPYDATITTRVTAPGTVVVASDLGRMECLIKPLQLGDQSLIQDFQTYFSANVNELAALTRQVFERAAAIRAQHHAIKTADAIHLAAAVESNCDRFLTHDQKLAQFTGIAVDLI